MTFPAELELARGPGSPGPGGLRLRKRPVAELEKLRAVPLHAGSRLLRPEAPLRIEEAAGQHGAGLEIRLRARLPPVEDRQLADQSADFLSLSLRGETILLNTTQGDVSGGVRVNRWSMPLAFEGGALEICILADRTTFEIYDLIGGTSLSIYNDRFPCNGTEWMRHIEVGSKHAGIMIEQLDVYHLSSTLPNHPPRELHKRWRHDSPAVQGTGLAEWETPAGNPRYLD